MAEILYQPAQPGDTETIRALLAAANLPHEDFANHLEHFWVAKQRGEVVGAIGLEIYGEAGLLRSLVVAPGCRGLGLGQALCARMLEYAQARGVKELYLLTTTAAGFFPRLGFTVTNRNQTPPAIQATTEFASLCPATAVCMVKRVG